MEDDDALQVEGDPTVVKDPIREFEHVHGHLTMLAKEIGEHLRDKQGQPRALSESRRTQALALLEKLRDELLQHFADEEEGLFPFIRKTVSVNEGVVDELERSHDAICGAIVRLAHLARHGVDSQLATLYDRFEQTYAAHSRQESDLFEALGRQLGDRDRAELAALLQGISHR